MSLRILLSEPAFRRVRPRLDAFTSRIECLVMSEDGTVRLDGRAVAPGDAGPEGAWLSNDVFFGPAEAAFLEVLERSAALDWVQSGGAGTDHPLFRMLAGKGVRVTTNHGQAVGMAEYVLWGVLNHFQDGAGHAADQAERRWAKRRSREIAGTRWLIVGFGAIGEAVARRARAFDAHVTGVRRSAVVSPHADAMTTPDRLGEHLGEADVVVLCLPRAPETTSLVDARFLAAMKPGSVLVNVGRGSVVDEDALLAALDAGKPEHAVLDVFRVEPLPADSRFWDHPRVTVTAHASAVSSGSEGRGDDLFLDNLARYVAGRELLNEVPR